MTNRAAPTNLGIGMLGYNIGKVHAMAWLTLPLYYYPPPARPVLVAVGGRSRERVESFARRFGFKKTYADWKALVKDHDVDVVDICTPPNLHAEPSILSLEAGKHVLCEKPMARNRREAEAMLRAARKSGMKHMTAFNFRFIPAVIYARKLIQEGFVGRVLNFRGAYLNIEVGDLGFNDPNFPLVWQFKSETAGYGSVSDLGSHILDIARFLAGEVTAVAGATATFVKERPIPESPEKKGKVEVEDSAVAALKFANGALGTIETSWMAPGRKDYLRFEVTGSEGSLRFNLERLNELEIFTFKDPNEKRGYRDVLVTSRAHPTMEKFYPEQGGGFGFEHTFVNEVHHLCNCIVNDKIVEPDGASFDDGYKNCVLMDAIIESSKDERWVHLE